MKARSWKTARPSGSVGTVVVPVRRPTPSREVAVTATPLLVAAVPLDARSRATGAIVSTTRFCALFGGSVTIRTTAGVDPDGPVLSPPPPQAGPRMPMTRRMKRSGRTVTIQIYVTIRPLSRGPA
jgi:hypothetical protein